MTWDELVEAINKIPGEQGWWHAEEGAAYVKWAELLANRTKFSFEKILEILEGVYAAAANEFGS